MPHAENTSTAEQWQGQQYRLTAFSTSPVVSARPWWDSFVKSPPENEEAKPRLGIQVLSASHFGGILSLKVEPGRIDWILESGPSLESIERGPLAATLGPLNDIDAVFRDLSMKWLPQCSSVYRLAFGADLLMPTHDRQSGYLALAPYLPAVTLDSENSSDFIYRINRPRLAKSSGLSINRLSTWSVVRWQVQVAHSSLPQGLPLRVAAEDYAIRLQLDINTDPMNTEPIQADLLSPIAEELFSLASDIAQMGDVP